MCVYQGEEMFTAAKNMITVHYEMRRMSILRWAVKKLVFQDSDFTEDLEKGINETIHRVIMMMVRSTPNSLNGKEDPGADDGEEDPGGKC